MLKEIEVDKNLFILENFLFDLDNYNFDREVQTRLNDLIEIVERKLWGDFDFFDKHCLLDKKIIVKFKEN